MKFISELHALSLFSTYIKVGQTDMFLSKILDSQQQSCHKEVISQRKRKNFGIT